MEETKIQLVPTRPQPPPASSSYTEDQQNAAVLKYLPLVEPIADLFRNRVSKADFPDVLSCGNLGLVKAAAEYNSNRDGPFEDYANRKIMAEIKDALEGPALQTMTPRVKVTGPRNGVLCIPCVA